MKPTYNIYIDWDCVDVAGFHDFSQSYDDISAYVQHFIISRGKDKDSNTYPAATMEMILENSSGKFYPTATTGDYVGKVRLWLPVKVESVFNGTTYPLYYGYINRITAYPIRDKQNIYFYCTDGIDLLTKTIVVQDMDDKTIMTDGQAIHLVLNAANWIITNTCTMSDANDDIITSNAHGLENGDIVMFSGASIPAALSTTTLYYVVGKTNNTFSVSLTPDGLAIAFQSDGSGTYIVMPRRSIDMDGGDITNFPETFEFTKPG